MQNMQLVSRHDIKTIYRALLALARSEGITVAEALCQASNPEDGLRIYEQVFDLES